MFGLVLASIQALLSSRFANIIFATIRLSMCVRTVHASILYEPWSIISNIWYYVWTVSSDDGGNGSSGTAATSGMRQEYSL